jgi:hypothetical protein
MRGRWSLVLAATLLAACTSSGDASSTAQTKRASASTTSTTRDPGCKFIVARTESRFVEPTTDLKYLTEATVTPAPCYDKVTFTFGRFIGSDIPPGYIVEYREPPFGLPGVANSTAGFKDAAAVLYVELRPAATVDRRLGRADLTYKGGLRLLFGQEIQHVKIVEWLQDLAPAPLERSTTTTTAGAPTTTRPTTTRRAPTTTSSTTTTTLPPATTTTQANAPINVPDQRVVWLIGLDSKRPFTVDAANQPPRVSILIMKR